MKVTVNGKLGTVLNTRKVQGETYYIVSFHDGYFTDPVDGSRRYDSNLIDHGEWFLKDSCLKVGDSSGVANSDL